MEEGNPSGDVIQERAIAMLEMMSRIPVHGRLIMADLGINSRYQLNRVYKRANEITEGLVKRVGKSEYYVRSANEIEKILREVELGR